MTKHTSSKHTNSKNPSRTPADTRPRSEVTKTAKMLLDGKFVRSESGHTYTVSRETNHQDPERTPDATIHTEVPNGSRKDARDAIRAAAKGAEVWQSHGAYLRSQIIYRIAEMLQTRADLERLEQSLRPRDKQRRPLVDAVDEATAYAGFCDKLGAILGSVNTPKGQTSSTEPRPVGTVGVWHGDQTSLVDLISSGCSALAAGNSVIQVAEGRSGLIACTLAEVLAVSDLPAGAWQIISCDRDDPIITLAGATGITAIDVVGHPRRRELETLNAEGLGRARTRRNDTYDAYGRLERIRWQIDHTTVWQPIGR